MTESFVNFLNRIQADADMIQQALRIHVSEQTGDLTREEMEAGLRAAVRNENQLDLALQGLAKNPAQAEEAALAYFQSRWDNPSDRGTIEVAFQHAKDKLPVVIPILIAVTVMYGMYLYVTEGKTSQIRKISKKPDGTFQYEESIQREPFAPIFSGLVGLFKRDLPKLPRE
jgi:hypothetical protein